MEALPNNLISQTVCWTISENPVKYEYGVIRLLYKEGTDIVCIVQQMDTSRYIRKILTTLKNN